MNLLDSLLDAIIRLDGDALVMHVGEKPYVVTTSEASNEYRGPLAWGQVELSSRVLTAEAVGGMLGQILPLDQRAALDEYGATDYEVAAASDPKERFTIVAARGGEDIWLEIRRESKRTFDQPMTPAELEIVDAAVRGQGHSAAVEEAEIEVDDFDAVPSDESVVDEKLDEAPAPPLLSHPDDAVHAEPELVSVAAEASVHESASQAGGFATPPPPAPSIASPAYDDGDDVPFEDEELAIPFEVLADTDLDGPMDGAAGLLPIVLDEPLDLDALQRAEAALEAEEGWDDDVMTEGDLGELLRASASAILLGQPDSFAAHEAVYEEELTARAPEVIEPAAIEALRDEELAKEAAPVAAVEFADVLDVREVASSADPEPVPVQQAPATLEAADAAEQESFPVSFDEAVPTQTSAPEPSVVASAPESTVAEPPTREWHPAPQDDVTPAAHESLGEAQDVPVQKHPAVVVPLSRHPRPDSPEAKGSVTATLQRLLRLAAGRGAATVHIVAQSVPMVRVDGEFSPLEGEPTLSGAFVERLLAELAPRGRDAAAPSEWITDVPEIGRVRCLTFRDHRGAGIIFRMVPARAIAADQLGLTAEVQALCTEADGLVLVAGGRSSGRSTLLSSFVDLINRSRSDYVITTESEIEFVHENKKSFVSQREVRGSSEAVAAAVRAASREEPDVLVIEDLRTPELVAMALEAAESGRLVFGAVPAVSTVAAIERVFEMFPADRRDKAQASLAAVLRGVVSQVLLRKLKGGRIAAREVLINTPAVASRIAEGKTFELHAALDAGRKYGMISFSDSLAELVREGTVHPAHAYRKAPDRDQFLAMLRREGFDHTIAERLA